MILLFTDFGLEGPYVGQMKAVLHREAPGVPVVDLMHDAPAFDPRAAAYLLAALAPEMPPDFIVLAVVDPGVGGARRPLTVAAGGRWYVGPDNGLLAPAARRTEQPQVWASPWEAPSRSPDAGKNWTARQVGGVLSWRLPGHPGSSDT